jgi:hypothetical protein
MFVARVRATFLFLDTSTALGRWLFGAALAATAVCGLEIAFRTFRNLADVVLDAAGVHVRRVFHTVDIPWHDLTGVAEGQWNLITRTLPTVVLNRANGRPVTIRPDYDGVSPRQFADDVASGWTEFA